ncbi:MAG: Rpn family recombination-promoting nuclease/putative transposase [Cyanobacteria bacterium J06642_2]
MRTDSIYYQLFSVYPASFFQLANLPAAEAEGYRFESVEVKETAFRIDGVFLPNDGDSQKPVILCEVQMQKDEDIYYRMFSELFIYLYRKKPPHPWCVVAIFAKRSLEPEHVGHHQELLASPAVRRIYLDEIPVEESAIGIALVQLLLSQDDEAPDRARTVVERIRTEIDIDPLREEIIELVETMLVYKFPQLSAEEIQAMYALSDLKKTRVYREALEEGREEGRKEGRQQGKLEARLELIPVLIKQGMSVTAIAAALNLSEAKVREVLES